MGRAEHPIPNDGTLLNGVSAESKSLLTRTKRRMQAGFISMSAGIASSVPVFIMNPKDISPAIILAFSASIGATVLGGAHVKIGIEDHRELKKTPASGTTEYSPDELQKLASTGYRTDFGPKEKQRLRRQGVLKRFRRFPVNTGIYRTGYSRSEKRQLMTPHIDLSQPRVTFSRLNGDPEKVIKNFSKAA